VIRVNRDLGPATGPNRQRVGDLGRGTCKGGRSLRANTSPEWLVARAAQSGRLGLALARKFSDDIEARFERLTDRSLAIIERELDRLESGEPEPERGRLLLGAAREYELLVSENYDPAHPFHERASGLVKRTVTYVATTADPAPGPDQ
jgi:hypothetical protein